MYGGGKKFEVGCDCCVSRKVSVHDSFRVIIVTDRMKVVAMLDPGSSLSSRCAVHHEGSAVAANRREATMVIVGNFIPV